MDWRSVAPQQAQDDLDELLGESVNAAARSLGAGDGFDPFMLVIDRGGSRAMRMSPQRPGDATEGGVITALEVAADRGELRARATVFDVTVTEPFSGDAIKVVLEHRAGIAIDVLVPYAVTTDSVVIDMDSANAAVGTRRLWV